MLSIKSMNITNNILLVGVLVLTSCGSQEWRLGNPYDDTRVMKKRQNEKDKITKRANKFRKGTAKHYIGEWKSHDGDINLFRRDGFDIGF